MHAKVIITIAYRVLYNISAGGGGKSLEGPTVLEKMEGKNNFLSDYFTVNSDNTTDKNKILDARNTSQLRKAKNHF